MFQWNFCRAFGYLAGFIELAAMQVAHITIAGRKKLVVLMSALHQQGIINILLFFLYCDIIIPSFGPHELKIRFAERSKRNFNAVIYDLCFYYFIRRGAAGAEFR